MSITVTFSKAGIEDLVHDFARIPAHAVRKVEKELDDGIGDITKLWKQNTRASAGDYAKHYIVAISDERVGLLHYETGPVAAMKQGRMKFEYGGPSVIHSPAPGNPPGWFLTSGGPRPGGFAGQRVGQTKPHLDGNRAADVVFPTIAHRVGEAVQDTFWP